MKNLIIIGAGGFAREVAWLVEEINLQSGEWNLLGFIDENQDIYGKIINGYPVLGDFDYFYNTDFNENVYSVCAVANPLDKVKLVKKAEEWGYFFVNLIHPSVKMSRYVEMGIGNIICADNIITTNISIGNHVSINPGCGIGHDVIIGDNCTLFWNVNLSGNVNIGHGCLIGTKSVIIQGITIGEWSVIGAGACVVKDVPANCTVVGIPASPIKFHE